METSGVSRRKVLGMAARTACMLAAAGTLPPLVHAAPGKGRSVTLKTDLDVIIRNGTIYDGTTDEPYQADIGIRGDKIFAIGSITGRAPRDIDAAGLIVTPGFIDVHTHCDLTFQRVGFKRYLAYTMPSWKGNYNFLYQGVTTVVTGNCGYGYTDSDYWLNLVDTLGFGTNVATLAPHGMLREKLCGADQRPMLSPRELDALKGMVADEMAKGAVGFSSGLAYAPGWLSPTEELIALAKVTRRHGGIYATHIRDETGKPTTTGGIGVLESLHEAIEVGRRAEIPVEISHLKIDAPINNVHPERILEIIEAARREGLPIHADQYPYDAGSTTITILLPNEFVTSTGLQDRYKTKAGRAEVRAAIEQVFTYLPPEKTLITMDTTDPSHEGKTLKAIAEQQGKPAADCYVDMVCEEIPPIGVFFSQDMDIVRALMPHDYIITASDGWTVPKGMTNPHPRVYGTFPKKIRQFVLTEKRLDLKAAIRSMTSLPAEKFNLQGRGRIAEGNYADIAVIDMKTLTDHATYLKPHQYAEGVNYLLVNGVVAIEKGVATGDRGGRALRKG